MTSTRPASRRPSAAPRARRLAPLALVAVLAVGATACSGSEGGSDGATTTTVGITTGTGDPALGRLADLDGSLDGLSDGELDCYRLSLAFVALTAVPAGVVTGTDPAGVAGLQQDLATVRAQVPAPIAADFDTYARGVQAFATGLEGVDAAALQDPATRQRVTAAGAALEAPDVVAAEQSIERWFAQTCPAPATTTTTAAG